jgi:hypothetical protein
MAPNQMGSRVRDRRPCHRADSRGCPIRSRERLASLPPRLAGQGRRRLATPNIASQGTTGGSVGSPSECRRRSNPVFQARRNGRVRHVAITPRSPLLGEDARRLQAAGSFRPRRHKDPPGGIPTARRNRTDQSYPGLVYSNRCDETCPAAATGLLDTELSATCRSLPRAIR